MATLAGCTVEQIGYAEAKALISRYEWLRSMPTGTRACYGLRTSEGELAGVAVFAAGPAPESGDLCGREHRSEAICLARGACVHWAHLHAASFLISKACRLARRDYGWRIFFAYADPSAGEIGTVYQACNWLYLGEGVGRSKGRGRLQFFNLREGRWRSERVLRKRRLKLAELRSHREWIAEWTPDKGRYVWFEGSRREKRKLIPTPVDSDSEGDSRIGDDLLRCCERWRFAMPIPLRGDFETVELRREARNSKDSGQARRLLALAAIYDGSTRTEAAKIGGVTLQIVRDWVMKFNTHGPSGLIAGKAPGQTPRLTSEHRAALARMVEDGPIPAVHGVVRWRLVDLCQQIFEAFHVVVSTQTMSRELRAMDYRKLSARSRHHAQATNAIEDF